MWEECVTSQLSRIRQRLPVMALSGPKALATSFAVRSMSLAAENASDFQACLSLSAAGLSSTLSSGWGTADERSGTVEAPALCEETTGGSNQIKTFTYHHVLRCARLERMERDTLDLRSPLDRYLLLYWGHFPLRPRYLGDSDANPSGPLPFHQHHHHSPLGRFRFRGLAQNLAHLFAGVDLSNGTAVCLWVVGADPLGRLSPHQRQPPPCLICVCP